MAKVTVTMSSPSSDYYKGVEAGPASTKEARSYAQGVIDGAKAKEIALQARKLVDAGEFEKELDAINYLYRR